jgi:hypothetical protein
MKTTNYQDTFIAIAEDCPVKAAQIPPQNNGEKTIAGIQYEMIHSNPYKYTSDDVIFSVYATKNNIPKDMLNKERDKFFSKGQPCMRSSPLAKRYGWGIHSDADGKIAIYAIESNEYKKLCIDKTLEHKKAMKSKR